MKKFSIIIIISLTSFFNFAQEGVWVTTIGRYTLINGTVEEAKRKALESARGEAIKEVVGINRSKQICILNIPPISF